MAGPHPSHEPHDRPGPANRRRRDPARPGGRVAIASAGLVWALLVIASYLLPAGRGLTGRYFAEVSGTTAPVHEVTDPVPSTRRMAARWGRDQPPAFRVVWSGFIGVVDPGDYRFALTSDDDAWLYVDEALVVDNGSGPHGALTAEGTARLGRGGHRVRLEYVQRGGDLALEWLWARGNSAYVPVPQWALSRRRVGDASVRAARVLSAIVPWLGICVAAAAAWQGRHTALRGGRRMAAWLTRLQPRLRFEPLTALLVAAAYAALFLLPPGGGLFHDAANAATDLTHALRDVMTNPRAFEGNVETPGAGREQALPVEVIRIVALLERHREQRYRVSDAIRSNEWMYQQTVATAWPRLLEPAATTLLLLSDEAVPAPCRTIDREGNVVLAACR
jgi:hypothetical protein